VLELLQVLALAVPAGCLAFWATDWWFGAP
jgi:hypothetical protein